MAELRGDTMEKLNSSSYALFDIDGTLLDSTSVWAQVPGEYLRRRNVVAEEDLADVFLSHGYSGTAKYIAEKYLHGEDYHKAMDAFCSIAAERYQLGIKEKPRATEYLRGLRELGIPCLAVTSNMKEIVVPAMEKLGMTDFITDVISVYDVGLDKRSPELYHFVARQLSVPEDRCVVFEDSLFAAESAKQANMFVVGIYDEGSKNDWQRLRRVADRVVYGYDELLREDVFSRIAAQNNAF